MINYIIVEDDMISFQKIKDFIDNYMMNYDYNYKVQPYQEIIDDTGFKVYYISKKDYLDIVDEIRNLFTNVEYLSIDEVLNDD